MGTNANKPVKKTSKKTSKKKTTKPVINNTMKPPEKLIEDTFEPQKPEPILQIDEKNKPEVEKSTQSFAFVTMDFKCPNCKKKKTIKKPRSFTPSENELICPNCGTPLKNSRAK